MPREQMIEVENVNIPSYKSRVNAEKYSGMRKALLKVLPKKQPGLTQAEMCDAVQPHLSQKLWPNGEKSMWWVKTVQLDLEAKGLLARNKLDKLTRWHRT